ncbi:interferon kappa [Perognathus longimembris pacificus]|uniref:interferon kappa n=1 Tax=Perognathus longimembris pacificus TaxID=214514 RepID=UPI002018DE7C|nr:interferon kappa [Perognathus longimembris pacificus]
MSIKADITPKYLWLVFLVGLFISPILSQCVLLSRMHLENLKLMIISDSLLIACLREIRAFDLPTGNGSDAHPTKSDIKEALYEITTQVLSIFSQYNSNSTWEKKHLTEIKMRLSEQIMYLEQCIREEKEKNNHMKEMEEDKMEHSGEKVLQPVTLEWRSYFNRIQKYLKDKKYSSCAWRIVQVEIRRCFSFFLTKLLLKK